MKRGKLFESEGYLVEGRVFLAECCWLKKIMSDIKTILRSEGDFEDPSFIGEYFGCIPYHVIKYIVK